MVASRIGHHPSGITVAGVAARRYSCMTRTKKIRWLHGASVAAAIIAVLLVASGASLWHIDAPGTAATCPICHFAHISVIPGVPAQSVSVHVRVAWVVPAESTTLSLAPILPASAPRAPPA